jgi:ribosomal protein S27E
MEGLNMIMEGCQGKPKISIMEKECPHCHSEIEIFSIDTEAVCENCGYVIYNDKLTCVKWCNYARKCFGDEAYESLMKIAQRATEKAS